MNYLLNINSIYILDEEINKIINKNDNIISLNNDDTKIFDIITECSYYSLLDTSKTIIVHNFKLTEENRIIINYLDNPNKDVKLILIASNIDKRSKLFKDIKPKLNYIEIKDLKTNDIINKINNYCKNNDIKIDYKSTNYLLETNLKNIDLVINEINKLSIISKTIDMNLIEEFASYIIPDESFELCDAIVEKKLNKISKLLNEYIDSKKEVIPFISLLAMQYRYIYSAKVTKKSADYLAALFGGKNSYPFTKAKDRINLYSISELENILINLADIDLRLKTSDCDPYSILKNFITSIL